MSIFCGLLLRSDSRSEFVGARFRVCASALSSLMHGQSDAPMIFESGPLWLAALTVAPWTKEIVVNRVGGFGVVAGDPLIDSARDATTWSDSASFVVDAMLSDRTAELSKARGMFAAAAWSEIDTRLTLATDKLANRCLYTKSEPDRFVFATSLRVLRLLVSRESVDEQGLAESLFLGQPLADRTLFRDVHVLEPGTTMVVRHDGRTSTKSYFDFIDVPERNMEREHASGRLHAAFSAAVKRRVMPGLQEAFLSGGMDSRSVVAELLDQGHRPRTFCTAFSGSADVVVSQIVAQELGIDHVVSLRTPADRVRTALDPFAIYAREHFNEGQSARPRAMWSGDGGSVSMGHVYLSSSRVALAALTPTADLIRQLFPSLLRRPTRQVSRARLENMAELALQGLLEQFRRLEAAKPDRRLFLFYLLNDQSRHLYHHFESIGVSRIELLAPFFDSDFLEMVVSMPVEWFLGHDLYNQWIQEFRCGAGRVYWQPYPDHIPGPHPVPKGAADQWSELWYESRAVCRVQREIAVGLICREDPLLEPYINRNVLRVAWLLNFFGIARLNYEISFARNLADQIGTIGA